MKTKHPTRYQNATFYLGKVEERLRRLERLDEKAAELNLNRSELLQKIADGEIELVPARRVKEPQSA